jgi:hypothetical protein
LNAVTIRLQKRFAMNDEVREMPPPSDDEIAQWADGIVYGRTPTGVEVYFDPEAREWRRARGPDSEG